MVFPVMLAAAFVAEVPLRMAEKAVRSVGMAVRVVVWLMPEMVLPEIVL